MNLTINAQPKIIVIERNTHMFAPRTQACANVT